MGYKIGNKANIGWDGCASTGEVRPSPSKSPREIVENLRAAFLAVTKKIGIFDYSTHSKKAPVGGHIHLAINQDIAEGSRTTMDLIHRCMASFYLPLMIGENIVNMNMRTQGHSYGHLSDYRMEHRGDGVYTYEFRAPTAEWLTTPKIANATLAYMGVIYNEVMKNPKAFAKQYGKIVWKTNAQGDAIQSLLLSDYTSPIEKLVKSIREVVRTFEFYPDYKDEIEYVFRPQSVLADKEKAHFNIVEGWELATKTPNKRTLLSDKKCSTQTDAIDFDAFASSVSVPHNGDTNTEVFATELKRRIINFGWKLKNTYYLFGLKKGMEDFLAFNKAGNIIYDGGQIKTTRDLVFANDLMGRMSARFVYDQYARTAKEKAELATNHITIGIPYSMRTKMKFKPFLNFIYDIEKGKFKSHQLKQSDLKEGSSGEFAKVYDVSSKEDRGVALEDDCVARDREMRIAGILPPEEDSDNFNSELFDARQSTANRISAQRERERANQPLNHKTTICVE